MDEKLSKLFELQERSCDALVLGYYPEEVLGNYIGVNLYIPSATDIEEAYGRALREIFGVKEGQPIDGTDSVGWRSVRDLRKLEKRILEGTREVICGDPDHATTFDNYLSSFTGPFEGTHISMQGMCYAFKTGERRVRFGMFENFWGKNEKERWQEIQELMRKFTKREFERKRR